MSWTSTTVINVGWTTGARSVALMTGDGEFTFSVAQSVGIVCGLNNDDLSSGYKEIQHGFYIENRTVRIIESGLIKNYATSFTVDAVFKITRINSIVTYYIDDVLLYTSSIESYGDVFLDCSLYADKDTIVDVEFTELNDPRLSSSLMIPALAVFGSELDYIGRVSLPALSVASYIEGNSTDHIILPAISASGGDGNFGFIQLAPLAIPVNDLVPEVNYGYCRLSAIDVSWRISDTYTAELSIPALKSFGTDSDGIGFVALAPLRTSIATFIDNSFLGYFPYFTGYNNYNDTLLTIPSPILTATATNHASGVSLTVPSPVLTAYSGAYTALEPPTPILAATATSPGFAVVTLELPEPVLTATAKTGDVATVTLVIPAPTFTAYSGAFSRLEMPEPVLSSTGTIFGFATVTLTIPSPELVATGEIYGLASVTLEIPSPILYAGMGNWVALEIPSPILVVVASPALTTAETTYAINLTTGAVTQLLLGGFDKLVTAHGRLYGLKAGALTRLEGDVDGTTTTIPATIRFAQQTFGTNAVKRCSDVYWSTREMDGLTMELVADERTVWRYQTLTDTAPAYGTHKIKTGRGVSFHTAGLTVQNRDGGQLDIGGVELLVSPLSRKPK